MAFPIKLNGIVLRTVNYREYDRMLTLFTQEQGRVEASARGARRPSSKLLAATTQFTLGEFLLNERGGQYYLAGCTVDKTHYALRESPPHLACATLFARLCLEVVQEGESNEGLFVLLLQALAYLEAQFEDIKSLTAAFLLRFLALNGQGLTLRRCVQCAGPLRDARFDFAKGGLACAEHASPQSPPATKEQVFALLRAAQGDRLFPLEPVEGCYQAMRAYTETLLDKQFPAFDYLERLL